MVILTPDSIDPVSSHSNFFFLLLQKFNFFFPCCCRSSRFDQVENVHNLTSRSINSFSIDSNCLSFLFGIRLVLIWLAFLSNSANLVSFFFVECYQRHVWLDVNSVRWIHPFQLSYYLALCPRLSLFIFFGFEYQGLLEKSLGFCFTNH